MKYAYYPGCSAHSTARDMHESSIAVAAKLGIELEEIKGWSCCGATSAHQTDQVLAVSLAAANLILAEKMKLDMVVNCAACYNRSKTANYEISGSPIMRAQIRDINEYDYDGSVAVRHFVEVLLKDIGIDKLRKSFKQSLNGMKIACYYGCYLVRPAEITGFDDPENPMLLDHLVNAMGGESLDWPGKVECCGGGLNMTRVDVVHKLSGSILDMAQESGAECIVVACPMCQTSLDLRQKDIEKATGKKYNLPVLYITQILGLCLGVSEKELGLKRAMVDASSIVRMIKTTS
ncbi:MAG: CoB--CoM heterodisulfide reductase iron-sulfur subunit B family protein [Chloroflexi bacterium]|nr:CoB--CoM heterodisulfide reductase iron-sulfur subunit B family protein [Chloroflexota bacterium]